jgi:hypothetical protein
MINIRQRRRADFDDDDPDAPFDRNGVLKDGHRVRVSVQMRDSMRREQPAHDGRQPLTDQQRRDLQGCRPGFRTLDSDTYRERKAWARDAYAEVEHRLTNAWRDGPVNGFGSSGLRGQVEGDLCTIDGAPGHLRRVGGRLVCVADDEDEDAAFDDSAFNDAQLTDARELAYRDYARELTRAWRRG